jgi:regulatory protein
MHDDGHDTEAPADGLFGPSGDAAAPVRRRPKRPPPSATQRALGLLTRREHSRRELSRKLAARGHEPDEVAAAVDKLTEAGWQDDARFAESLLRSRADSGYGPRHIRAELGTHGLDEAVIAAAFDAWEGDWLDNARDLVRRRFGSLPDDLARRRKVADLLLRRGFDGDTARAASQWDDDGY